MYNEAWVEKLYWGFKRNLTLSFDFVLYTDRRRGLIGEIEQRIIKGLGRRGYGDCIIPYELGKPMILVGLDTIVTGNIDKLAHYCFTGTKLMLPRDPYHKEQACNGVALVPRGHRDVALLHRGENDMEWVRKFPHLFLDDELPGYVRSYKGHVEKHGLNDTRIVYFHGEKKPHQLRHVEWIKQHWRMENVVPVHEAI